ncbi:hypothetical protein TVAG_229260 [Trichomonas vaginalis G3]|uniref:receptor protein-tyrosine kinase n=1 Tax=Trichomonas vaginalis (strain ATCC PRA-98 / G3) TaxID=412133 RepID=A2FBR2_TRIV3|nr:glycine-rich protein family [Trichomonas vaginalis G3]EAX97659.1 hypothetical protein TVAG_229260 [Trichomonas vaginalis G3]KAI5510376.1 glycine-rich protein family [Trichomonas vaginalis G3]|eukprot:XP_001310589.1 hypothetical protein [Trichomonas vaginalis G3]
MISYKLSKKGVGQTKVRVSRNQYVFEYPCGTSRNECTLYTVNFSPGAYRFEAWGSIGQSWDNIAIPGKGSYTSGILQLHNFTTLYLYIGSISIFNNMNISHNNVHLGGGSSDVRVYVNENFDWFDPVSLRSRIMVAGGGGGAEWRGTIAGNGGGLEGGTGVSGCYNNFTVCPEVFATGGSQKSGGFITSDFWKHANGLFGMAAYVKNSIDLDGLGGNGYWSGASFDYSGGGGGGSSFISGYDGCIALEDENSEVPSTKNSSIHYSGYYFETATMQKGNTSMPLYYSRYAYGIGNNYSGCIRITILPDYNLSCECNFLNMVSFMIHMSLLVFNN